VTARLARFLGLAGVVGAAVAMAGCGGEFVRDGRSPARLMILNLGVDEDTQGNTVRSDVIRRITSGGACSETNPCFSVFNDVAEVEFGLQLRDPGNPASPSSPSEINSVTIDRYRVVYRRTDGLGTQGVDVPYAFDSAFTITVPPGGATGNFQLVRHSAKEEAPLRALGTSGSIISTIAEVTFWGHDQAGNDVSVTGQIGVDFADFADATN
jgi:hypothetical protein